MFLRAGFTLIELSVVLVIIGLLAGGVMIGQDLLNAAATRSEARKITEFETAYRAFELKYSAIPGDFNSNGMISGVTHYGNGNRLVDTENESVYVWEHLSKGGFIPGRYTGNGNINMVGGTCVPGTVCPGTQFSDKGAYWMQSVTPGSWSGLILGASRNQYANSTGILLSEWSSFVSGGMQSHHAYGVDSKLDDGMANTGKFHTINDLTFTCVEVLVPFNCSGSFSTCTWQYGNYDLDNTLTSCLPAYIMQ